MDEPSRISIVDDDASVRRALKRFCKSAGFHVDAFESAEAFLDSQLVDQTDCLVLDVHLPGRDGLQLQCELMKLAGGPPPIIFVTAFENAKTRIEALSRGAVEFLYKPLDNQRLLEAIQQAIEK